jgi:superfamily I DNA and/or RNA helicase
VPELAELVRDPIYGGAYVTPEPHVLAKAGVTPLASVSFPQPLTFLDTSAQPEPWGKLQGTSFVNAVEAELVVRVCERWEDELRGREQSVLTISVLAFYGAQARLIRHRLGHPHYRRFRQLSFQVVDSVDRIQGQQSDLVIVTFGRASKVPPGKPRLGDGWGRWLQDPHRLNVACTRARRAMVLVGHRHTLRRLNGVEGSERFYRNLFAMLDRGQGTLLTDLQSVNRR